MKREIKFRGRRADNGAWVYGGFHLHQEVKLCIATAKELEDNERALIIVDGMADWNLPVPIHSIEVDPETVGQFVGLNDKNGKEIYADDILFDGEHKFRVYAMYGGFGIKAPHWSGIMEDMVMGDDLIMQPLADAQTMSYISQSMEVIGNIYENPELLNK